jgi:hypothetical protein
VQFPWGRPEKAAAAAVTLGSRIESRTKSRLKDKSEMIEDFSFKQNAHQPII